MGTPGQAIVKAAAPLAKSAVTSELGGLANKLLKSTEAMFNESQAGRALVKGLRDIYEPTEAKAMQLARERTSQLPGMANNPKLLEQTLDAERKNVTTQLKDSFFGKKRELLTAAIRHAHQEKGPVYAENFASGIDMYFREPKSSYNYYRQDAARGGKTTTGQAIPPVPLKTRESIYEPKSGIEKIAGDVMGTMLLSHVAIPHTFQSLLNSSMSNGKTATLKAAVALFSDFSTMKRQVELSGALESEMWREIQDAAKPNSIYNWVTTNLKAPGINQLRKLEIVHSGIAGKFSAIESASDLLQGRNVKSAEINLKYHGLDPAKIMQQGGLSVKDEQTAIFRAANDAMMIKRGLDTPYAWDSTGMARQASMYKHFAFNQGKLIKDYFKREYEKGGASGLTKAIASFSVMFPIAGFTIRSLENLISLKDPTESHHLTGAEPIDQVLDLYGYGAGMGLAFQLLRSIKRRGVAEFMVGGPVIGTIGDLVQDTWTAGTKGNAKPLARSLLHKIPIVGGAAAEALFPTKKKSSSPF